MWRLACAAAASGAVSSPAPFDFDAGVEKYTFTDADAGDLLANEASDDDDDEEEDSGFRPHLNSLADDFRA